MIGKHFLVHLRKKPHVKRQYTVCNVMRPDILKQVIKMADDVCSGSSVAVNLSVFDDEDRNQVALTAKNYFTANGVASSFFECDRIEEFMVKGPMGKGLQLKKEGTHVAFVGGTGVLVFLDLVAAIMI